ncbi:hypothetical protein O9G_004995 [Rozella allomycis CSF55]|uniref:HAT C-terminal dimerisation domain-containing protein n=1 Tax=Rozella allomycis (strain CSF55) TaxID=988480 RepID=A0A075AUX4_ROZAC|nr:hypothetical protein O9G_004995 [Rozella allomycis CSF55]|eukprot:EPZ34058.1 hypothetical protein O9G_004995 [Rozella allomycis CSF55]
MVSGAGKCPKWCGEIIYPGEKEKQQWWSLRTDFPLLQPLARRVLCTPTSSAANGWSWSIHEFIHSKRRNRLSAEKVERLVFIYSNIDDTATDDHLLYMLHPEAEMNDDLDEEDEEVE